MSVVWVTLSGHLVGVTQYYYSVSNEKRQQKTCLTPVIRIVPSDDQTIQSASKSTGIPIFKAGYIRICGSAIKGAIVMAWWRHQMETFPYYSTIWPVNSSVTGEFTGHRWIPLTKACDAELCFRLDLRLNKQLSKWRRRWFDAPSQPLWRHCNGFSDVKHIQYWCSFTSTIFWVCSQILSDETWR